MHPKQRCLLKDDVIGSDKLTKAEWAIVQRDNSLIQRVFAFNVFVKARSTGVPSRRAYEQAVAALHIAVLMKVEGAKRDEKNFSLQINRSP